MPVALSLVRGSGCYICRVCAYAYEGRRRVRRSCPKCGEVDAAVRSAGGVYVEDPDMPCPGCESGIDADGPHRGPDGVYYRSCCTEAAERCRRKQLKKVEVEKLYDVQRT